MDTKRQEVMARGALLRTEEPNPVASATSILAPMVISVFKKMQPLKA